MTIVARATTGVAVADALRTTLRQMDPSVALNNVRSMNESLMVRTAAPRLLMFVLATFAVLTGLLAAIGVYGLLACLVNERRRELAIRLALGAQPYTLARVVTMQALTLAAAGVVLGLVVAQLGAGYLRAVLFQTRTTDVMSLSAAAAILLSAALVASIAPAHRAARVAPAEGLKE
jgi:ABC-type antimicrobial peptide transport system permease subunit